MASHYISLFAKNRVVHNVVLKVLNSTTVLIVAFSLLCFVFAIFIPNRLLNASCGVPSRVRNLVTKLGSFLSSGEQPDVIIFGSSLVLVPAIRCDNKLLGIRACNDRAYYDYKIPEYSKSIYFKKLLQQSTGVDASIKNLGIASSIMSDQYEIFKLLLAEHKNPKVIILGLAPRDFLDNTQERHLETPTLQFVQEFHEAPRFSAAELSLLELQNVLLRAQHRVDKVLATLKETSIEFVSRISKHEARADFYVSANTQASERPNRLKDLDTYRKLYNPPNFNMLAQQSNYLRKFLSDAQSHNIAVIVVNMPLTKENVQTLAPQALKAYENSLSLICQEKGLTFVNIGAADSYSLNDFEDCCHLNSRGGEKFYARLVSAIAQDKKLIASLSN